MRIKALFVSLLLLGTPLAAQEETNKVASNNTQQTELPTSIAKAIDTLSITEFNNDLPKVTITLREKDTTVYNLEDIAKARRIDSLWLDHLYNNELFEEIYGAITNWPEQDSLEQDSVDYPELPTELLKERLSELNARTPFRVEYNPSLENVIKGYLKNRRESLTKLMALSQYYFPLFEEELDRQGLPLELKYLAIVESALNPRATSRVGAKGLWQFMFQTGKLFGLEVSSYVDERSDPIMSTEAAAKYLSRLYDSLEDWDLALAAYNSGPGNVSKAIRRSGGRTNYWNIRNYLPRETAGYVPAFLATMYIFEYATEHGFQPNGPKFPFIATDTIKVKQMISLEQVSMVTNTDLAELEFLNPSYKLGIIPVLKDEDYVLRLPVDAIGKFVTNEQAIYALADKEFKAKEATLPEFTEQNDKIQYRVRSGDFLGKIASRYGVSVSQIRRWNGLRNDHIRIGQRLTIYPRKSGGQDNKDSKNTSVASGNGKIYTVQQGDTLWSISKKFPSVSVEDLKKWNDISGDELKPGMKLKISRS